LETFPAASHLLPRRLRSHISSFFRFVRLADEIADDPDLEPESRLAYLDALERVLTTGQARHAYLKPALDLRSSLQATGVSDRHARQVLRAFRRDAAGARCHTWSDLLLYCRFSASPVGRYILELHGESTTAGPACDALCSALQILSHLQDCHDDWIRLGRCYIPLAWFEEAGVSVERLVETDSDPRTRAIFDRMLDHIDRLLLRAGALPGQLTQRGLRMEAAVALSLAESLVQRLRTRDPLRRRVLLLPHQRMFAMVRGIARGLTVQPAG
jgi:squalene synthase HpnC